MSSESMVYLGGLLIILSCVGLIIWALADDEGWR